MKKTHKAHLISQNGDVSPLCAEKPRKIKLDRETWTIVDQQVTCKKCLKILGQAQAGKGGEL